MLYKILIILFTWSALSYSSCYANQSSDFPSDKDKIIEYLLSEQKKMKEKTLNLERIINNRISKLENNLNKINNRPEIIATLIMNKKTIISSTKGVTYNASTGIITFPNPKNLSFTPVISNMRNNTYMTVKIFIRKIEHNKFKVWETTLDTGNRNYPPSNGFSAIIVGF